ncbi:hypothetical protein P3T40_008759 [Paraburkholderia sp. EB58]
MKPRNVLVHVEVDSRQISAHFRPSTGRLVIVDGPAVIEAFKPPDSWMALASVNTANGWGTRPTSADLRAFLERYVANHPGFNAGESQ